MWHDVGGSQRVQLPMPHPLPAPSPHSRPSVADLAASFRQRQALVYDNSENNNNVGTEVKGAKPSKLHWSEATPLSENTVQNADVPVNLADGMYDEAAQRAAFQAAVAEWRGSAPVRASPPPQPPRVPAAQHSNNSRGTLPPGRVTCTGRACASCRNRWCEHGRHVDEPVRGGPGGRGWHGHGHGRWPGQCRRRRWV